MAKNSVKAIPLSSFNTAGLTPAYQAINGTGLPQACFFIRFVNTSGNPITISYDGVTDHETILDDRSFDLPVQANSSPNNYVAHFAKGTIVYAKGTAGAGALTLSGYYQGE